MARPSAPGSRCFTRKVVRDLLWAVTSPHLIDAALFPVLPVGFGCDGSDAHTTRLHEWLTTLETDPTHLIAFLQAAKTKSRAKALALGVYFASLLEYWLQFCPLLQVVQFERGKQIISASNQTLGQLKFLFRVLREEQPSSEENAAFDDFHVECSVKFFLLHPLDHHFQSLPFESQHSDGEAQSIIYPLEQFVGPHLGENLAWRVQEVARKLDMCRGESVQRWLRDHYSDRVASRIVLKGYLFYPLHQFHSTSEVSRGHDWCFHRNPTSTPADAAPPRHNPKVGADHLRGWWASDLEHEFASRVRNNDVERIGESRFVVLPKLHWLTPLIAEENPDDGRVVVCGEPELHIETIDTMSLEELIVFARSHFATLADSPESQAKGGVVMPLLVAEIVRCRSSDMEFDASRCRWKELSRGFLLDPKSWDPLPLCHEPVRFKRTNDDDVAGAEREYEGRREWANDGVIKPTDEEAERERRRKLHSFEDVHTVTPEVMCGELLGILAREQKTYTHANLKQSIVSVLTSRHSAAAHSEAMFLLESLRFLVLGQLGGDAEPTEKMNSSKVIQRVAHLLLDAFEGSTSATRIEDTIFSQFVELVTEIARDERRWSYINLSLRAIDILVQASKSSMRLDELPVFQATVRQLLETKIPRWNAVAVEIVRVVFTNATSEAASSLRREMLATLISQQDYKHAEQLATICCVSDVDLVLTLFKRFNALNMTKPMKRLRKALGRSHALSGLQAIEGASQRTPAFGFQHALGSAVDVDVNRATVVPQIPPLKWTLADTADQITEIHKNLKRVMNSGQTQPTFVGLDCEWRPQFLIKESAMRRADEELQELFVGEDEGVSVYQIAFDDHVYVVDVQVLGEMAKSPLEFIWSAPRGAFILVGFCVGGDLRRLNHSFPSLLADEAAPRKLLVELKQLALYRQLPAGPWGLSQLHEACFNEPVAKEEQCSDWGLRPLSESQLQYAARDAYAVRNIALHLLADIASVEEDLTRYVEQFAVVTRIGKINAELALGHWLTTLAPLNESHVRAALEAFGLPDLARSLFSVDKTQWKDQARLPEGLIVKTIAVILRRGEVVHYAAVVLNVELSIHMPALASHLNVHVDDLQLADPETLLRVFGYPRGSIGPIGLREQHAVHVVLDAALLSETALLPGAGREDLTYAISPSVLIETLHASVVALTANGSLHVDEPGDPTSA